jgi:hypothetical protein
MEESSPVSNVQRSFSNAAKSSVPDSRQAYVQNILDDVSQNPEVFRTRMAGLLATGRATDGTPLTSEIIYRMTALLGTEDKEQFREGLMDFAGWNYDTNITPKIGPTSEEKDAESENESWSPEESAPSEVSDGRSELLFEKAWHDACAERPALNYLMPIILKSDGATVYIAIPGLNNTLGHFDETGGHPNLALVNGEEAFAVLVDGDPVGALMDFADNLSLPEVSKQDFLAEDADGLQHTISDFKENLDLSLINPAPSAGLPINDGSLAPQTTKAIQNAFKL